MSHRLIVLACGRENIQNWRLDLSMCLNTKNFMGHFCVGESIEKHRIRMKDRLFFKHRLPLEMYDKYEIDHDWQNGAVVTLKTPKEHRNTNKGKANQKRKRWIEMEEWL